MTFFNIFDRIGSKLIGLKFVGSSISPDLWIGMIIECFHGSRVVINFYFFKICQRNVVHGIKTPFLCKINNYSFTY